MRYLNNFLILSTGLAFVFYGFYYFFSPAFKLEFERFGLKKFGAMAATLQILGGLGLLVGFILPVILMVSSLGLAILMLLGVATRIRVKDSFFKTLPALFLMLMNTYIFIVSLSLIG